MRALAAKLLARARDIVRRRWPPLRRLLLLASQLLTLRDYLGLAALAGMIAGWWMIWPALGLIIPCTILFALVTHSRLREEGRGERD